MIYKSYAKINLYLDVVSRYKNGYHGLRSVFARISLYDVIEYNPNNLGKVRVIDTAGVLPEDNLLTRAAALFSRYVKKDVPGVDFKIEKRIPICGGLGGGSSNAAAVLKILNKVWNTRFGTAKLEHMGSRIGADVPFFIKGGIQKIAGIGQICRKVPMAGKNFSILLIAPGIKVETPGAFAELDEQGLCRDTYENRKKFAAFVGALEKGDFAGFTGNIYNKFENPVFSVHPELQEIKQMLLSAGAEAAFMSGSGSTMAGIFRQTEQSEQKLKKTIENFEKKGYKAHTVRIV